MELTQLVCKNCERGLDPSKIVGGVIKCDYCYSEFTVSTGKNKRALDFLRLGEHALDVCKFDDAFTAFKRAAETDKNDPEAYFGMALAEFRIRYLADAVDAKDAPTEQKPCHMQPICHFVTDKKFVDNKYYQTALSLASPEQRALYFARGQEIDYIINQFASLEASGLDYDCFICVKVSGEGKRKTIDSDKASALYFYLKEKGYRPFYSEHEMQSRTGADYEALILYALYSSKCMVVVCGDEEYLQTQWVKNEYTRFLSLINDEQKEDDAIAMAFLGKPIERLPGRNGKLQGVQLIDNPAAFSTLENFVARHVSERKPDDSARSEELIKELEEKLKDINAATRGATVTVGSLLKRAGQLLFDRDFNAAKTYYNDILKSDAENAEAWRGLFLCEMQAIGENYITLNDRMISKLAQSYSYKRAVMYSSASGEMTKFAQKVRAYALQYKQRLLEIRESYDREKVYIENIINDGSVEKMKAFQRRYWDRQRLLDRLGSWKWLLAFGILSNVGFFAVLLFASEFLLEITGIEILIAFAVAFLFISIGIAGKVTAVALKSKLLKYGNKLGEISRCYPRLSELVGIIRSVDNIINNVNKLC